MAFRRKDVACPSCNIHGDANGLEGGVSGTLVVTMITQSPVRLALTCIFVNAAGHVALYVFLLAPYATKGYADFAIFYTAGRIVQSGAAGDLYNEETQWQVQRQCCGVPIRSTLLAYNHGPHEALLFALVANLSYPVAYGVWTIFNLACLLLIALVLQEYSRRWLPHWSLLIITAIASFPFLIMFAQGQDSLLLTLIYFGVFRCLKTKRPQMGGACLALGIFKPQLIAPFVAILVLRRMWKAVLGFLLGVGALVVISIGLIGESAALGYVKFLLKFARMPAEVSGAWPVLMPNVRGLLVILLSGVASPPVITGLVVLASMWLIWIAAQNCSATVESQFSAALVAAMLASYHFYSHDAVLLILPVVLGFSTLRSRPAKLILGVATALWFVSPAIFILVKYNLVGLLGIPVLGIGFALLLDTQLTPTGPCNVSLRSTLTPISAISTKSRL